MDWTAIPMWLALTTLVAALISAGVAIYNNRIWAKDNLKLLYEHQGKSSTEHQKLSGELIATSKDLSKEVLKTNNEVKEKVVAVHRYVERMDSQNTNHFSNMTEAQKTMSTSLTNIQGIMEELKKINTENVQLKYENSLLKDELKIAKEEIKVNQAKLIKLMLDRNQDIDRNL